ncbi:MAG TPA: sigma-70 family RNA polymerase sigma factor [Solirubrobacterales bacterium]|nr:sigma-70 family RNA polymerase sigma factor [Solirubrobacterales bacterium]
MEVRRLDHRVGREAGLGEGWDWDEARRFCLRFAFRYAKNQAEAEDIAQDAMVRAWRKRDSLRDAAARKSWLATIVRNEALRELTRKRPFASDLLEVTEGRDDDRVLATVERADLQAALERLNKRDRQLVRLRYDEDMTQEAIARRLGIPLGTVKVRLHRVRAKLRRSLAAV